MILKVIVKGSAKGKIMKTSDPINFLGAVDKKTGKIKDKHHSLYQKSLKDSILVFPHGIGSSVGAYTIYSLKSNHSSPIAMICSKPDITVVSGCALANIPLIIVTKSEFDNFQDGEEVYLNTESEKIL